MGTRKIKRLQVPVTVLYRCYPWGQCNFFECFPSVCFPLPQGSSKREACTAFLKFIKFSVPFPRGWYTAGNTRQEDIRIPSGERTYCEQFQKVACCHSVLLYKSFRGWWGVSREERWDCCSHSRRILTSNLPLAVNSQWWLVEHTAKGGGEIYLPVFLQNMLPLSSSQRLACLPTNVDSCRVKDAVMAGCWQKVLL